MVLGPFGFVERHRFLEQHEHNRLRLGHFYMSVHMYMHVYIYVYKYMALYGSRKSSVGDPEARHELG